MSFKNFFRMITISGVISIICVVALTLLIQKESKYLENVQEKKVKSLLLSYELRQSSNDLTRLARTYVVTKNSEYEKMYWDIVNIRAGKQARPKDYDKIYWDFVVNYEDKPIEKGEKISLRELMTKAGFTKEEFSLLDKAEKNSNELIKLETIAMNSVKTFANGGGIKA